MDTISKLITDPMVISVFFATILTLYGLGPVVLEEIGKFKEKKL